MLKLEGIFWFRCPISEDIIQHWIRLLGEGLQESAKVWLRNQRALQGDIQSINIGEPGSFENQNMLTFSSQMIRLIYSH